MAQVLDLLERKGSTVWTIHPMATVLDAARAMNEHRIGALIVEHNGQVHGIFTERDLLRRVVAVRRNPAETRVADVMTLEVTCCSPDTDLDEARGAIRDRRIRHLPVADSDGHIVGMVSIGDLNAELQVDQERTLFQLSEYISGRT